MKTKIVFLFTLLALAPIIHGRHTSSNHRYEKLDESKPVELVEPEELEELKDPEELEDQEELEDLEEVEEFEGPPPEETEESSAEELSEGGVCSVEAEDRNDCGWIGIDNTTCENRGCCYDETVSDAAWCFYPTDNKCYGIDPVEREDCGYSGIQREECENERGCCFDHTVPNVPWCFKGTEPPAEGVCSVEAEDRNDCGWIGIDEATCEYRGCCYDETVPDVAWCFYPTDNKCYGIDPVEREDCGHSGIQREECENDRGCCFDHTVPNVPWCFKGTEPPAKPANDHSTLGDICDVESEDRNDCGWYGIDEATCEARGCCYDDTKPKAKWCFYPTDNKCYGIKPQEREDCGYIGIQREECENDRGCCFDHTVQGVPWCFKATGPVSVAPPEVETQEGSAGASEA
ncbi:hypothetical protein pdam_00002998 [Pocillopora damicornis]|uniref:P-type domain-containing protein n=1 Tax=Pocillopora damicornis TaxID=46731 RepID=A0A3M6U7M1_POCDA|nr:integumentary mucin C.1-like isoform X1 [Pocillopora damicornis]RMX49673.1 hypothetical protein pdam_00002998 [Pocillopora damicornis]